MKRSPMKRGGRIKPKRRTASEFARIYGSKERVAFVKSLPCIAVVFVPSHQGGIENAHVENGGSGRKANADRVIPLCGYHHRMLHAIGRRSFEHMYLVDLNSAASKTEAAWQAHRGNVNV